MIIDLIDVEPYGEDRMMATVDVTDDEGVVTRTAYFLPLDAMEWRVAEYGLEDVDMDTILDLLLFEPYLRVPEGLGLYEAPTVEEAKAALLDALKVKRDESNASKSKRTVAKAKSDKDKEVATKKKMVELAWVDPDVIDSKRAIVQTHRQKLQEEAATPKPSLRAGRAEHFKKLKEGVPDAAQPYIPVVPR